MPIADLIAWLVAGVIVGLLGKLVVGTRLSWGRTLGISLLGAFVGGVVGYLALEAPAGMDRSGPGVALAAVGALALVIVAALMQRKQ